MENEQNQKVVGSNLTGTATPDPSSNDQNQEKVKDLENDQDYLRKAEDELPDANKEVENTDAILGDVHPIDRDHTSQEEHNANKENDANE